MMNNAIANVSGSPKIAMSEAVSAIYTVSCDDSIVYFAIQNGRLSGSVHTPRNRLQPLLPSQIDGLDMGHIFGSVKEAQYYLDSFWYTVKEFGTQTSVKAKGRLLGGMHNGHDGRQLDANETRVMDGLRRNCNVSSIPQGCITNASCGVDISDIRTFYRACSTEEFNTYWKKRSAPHNGYLSPTVEYAAGYMGNNNILIEIEFVTRNPNQDVQTLARCYHHLSNNVGWGKKPENGVTSLYINPDINSVTAKPMSVRIEALGFPALPEECRKNTLEERRSLLNWLLDVGIFTLNVKIIAEHRH